MRQVFISNKFMSDDKVPFLVDTLNRVWIIRTMYDEDGVECDTVADAVTAEVTHSPQMLCGVANLTTMIEPRIN
jgi:hypothetical protein